MKRGEGSDGTLYIDDGGGVRLWLDPEGAVFLSSEDHDTLASALKSDVLCVAACAEDIDDLIAALGAAKGWYGKPGEGKSVSGGVLLLCDGRAMASIPAELAAQMRPGDVVDFGPPGTLDRYAVGRKTFRVFGEEQRLVFVEVERWED